MRFTPHAAFGKVVILAQTAAGDTRVVPIGRDGLVKSGWYFYTHGVAKVHVIETGEQLEDRLPGWLNAEHAGAGATTAGNLQLHFPVPTEWLCIPHQYNRDGLPTLASMVFRPGQKTILENGTDMFLVRGKLSIKDKVFTGPTQVRIRSGDVEATPLDNVSCYGVKFL